MLLTKYSCTFNLTFNKKVLLRVNARGLPTAAYPVYGLSCPVGYSCLGWEGSPVLDGRGALSRMEGTSVLGGSDRCPGREVHLSWVGVIPVLVGRGPLSWMAGDPCSLWEGPLSWMGGTSVLGGSDLCPGLKGPLSWVGGTSVRVRVTFVLAGGWWEVPLSWLGGDIIVLAGVPLSELFPSSKTYGRTGAHPPVNGQTHAKTLPSLSFGCSQ